MKEILRRLIEEVVRTYEDKREMQEDRDRFKDDGWTANATEGQHGEKAPYKIVYELTYRKQV